MAMVPVPTRVAGGEGLYASDGWRRGVYPSRALCWRGDGDTSFLSLDGLFGSRARYSVNDAPEATALLQQCNVHMGQEHTNAALARGSGSHSEDIRASTPQLSAIPTFRRLVATRRIPAPFDLCEDAARLVVDFAAGSLLELLAVALVDRTLHSIAQMRFYDEMRWYGRVSSDESSTDCMSTMANMLLPPVAQQFVGLPGMLLSSPGVTGYMDGQRPDNIWEPFGDENLAVLHCSGCETPIVKTGDILSHHYRISTGRGYLVSSCHNVTIGSTSVVANYTTGTYTVRSVSCSQCAARLGVTYVGAEDSHNQYKVGKFLVEQQLLIRPPCCMTRSRRVSVELPTACCDRCKRTAMKGALQLVDLMTHGFHPGTTRRLYTYMVRQHGLETLAEPRVVQARRLLAAPRALVSWCLPLLRPCNPNAESVARLSLTGFDERTSQADSWSSVVLGRVAMLACLQGNIREHEQLTGAFSTIIRFLSGVCRVAHANAPPGAVKPERYVMLFLLVPSLIVCAGDSPKYVLRAARALTLALRKEWIIGPASGGGAAVVGERPLNNPEIELLIGAIAEYAATFIQQYNEGIDIDDEEFGDSELFVNDDCSNDCPEDSMHQCHGCGAVILDPSAILASNYRIMTGPAYLASGVHNVVVAEELQEAVYVSGVYTVREISCSRCEARLGVTYAGAENDANRFKVGKFLLAKDQLLSPPGLSTTEMPMDEAGIYTVLMGLAQPGRATAASPHTFAPPSRVASNRVETDGSSIRAGLRLSSGFCWRRCVSLLLHSRASGQLPPDSTRGHGQRRLRLGTERALGFGPVLPRAEQ